MKTCKNHCNVIIRTNPEEISALVNNLTYYESNVVDIGNGFQFQVLSDSEIIEELNNVSKDEIENTKETDKIIDVLSAAKAFHALDVAFKWLGRQIDIDTIHLFQLKKKS